MPKKILTYAAPVTGLVLFVIAVAVLHHELKAYHYHDIIRAFRQIPSTALLLAGVITIFNYGILSLNELLGFRYINHSLSGFRIFFTSFISYAFSNNVGFYTISGSAVRFSLYSRFGLSSIEITKLIVFLNGVVFWLGLCTVSSLVFVTMPFTGVQFSRLPVSGSTGIGLFLSIILVSALLFTAFRKKPIRFRQWEFGIPHTSLLLTLMVTSVVDWLSCGAVMYVLLPLHTVTFAGFMVIFLTAMVTGLVSHVPGGLGVFESTLLVLLPHENASVIFGALCAFRIIYYLLPLGAGSVLLGGFEFFQRKKKVTDTLQTVGRWGASAIPYLFALLTFIGGMVLLFSGATPSQHHRLTLLIRILPLPLLEISHFLGSVLGIVLIMLSWGLYRRLNGAYHSALLLLCGGALFSLFKGLDYEEALVMVTLAIILLPGKKHFYRKTSLIDDRFSPGWLLMIGIALISTLWLGLFSYKHVEYANELWWQFSLHNNASRFMRAMVGSMVTAIIFAFLQFLKPHRMKNIGNPAPDENEQVRSIVQGVPVTHAWLALLGDKRFLFDQTKRAFIMYGIEGRSWISMGDPVGDPSLFPGLIWKFREECDRHNGRPVFYEVSKKYLPLYLDPGLTLLKIGEEARVPLATFTLEGGGSRKTLRQTLRRLEQEGCTFEIIQPEGVPTILPTLKTVSDNWLTSKKVREKRFSLGRFHEPYLLQTPVAVVRSSGKIIAFANIWMSGMREELSVDLMRYHGDAPRNVIDFLFGKLMLWGKEADYTWFNLGMAPFSGLEDRTLAPLWNRAGALLFSHGDNFYNFQGLRRYKDKFDPVWEPCYLATPPGLALPLILKDISSLVSRGLKGVFTK